MLYCVLLPEGSCYALKVRHDSVKLETLKAYDRTERTETAGDAERHSSGNRRDNAPVATAPSNRVAASAYQAYVGGLGA